MLSGLPIVTAGVESDDSGVEIEPLDHVEWQAALLNIPRVLGGIEFDVYALIVDAISEEVY